MKVSWEFQKLRVVWTNPPPDKTLEELKDSILSFLSTKDRKQWEGALTRPFQFED